MKNFQFILLCCLLSHISLGQTTNSVEISTAIKEDGSSPDQSAILDVQSDDKGLLIPRMTEANRDAISAPATGLLVYQTDGIDGYYYFDGLSWIALAKTKDQFNPTMPFGSSNLTPIQTNIDLATPYTVPADTYLFAYLRNENSSNFPITINNISFPGYGWMRLFLRPNDVISTSDPAINKFFLDGYTIPVGEDLHQVEVVYFEFVTNGSYTVPAGKQFYFTWMHTSPFNSSSQLFIDGAEIDWIRFFSGKGSSLYFLVDEGQTITQSNGLIRYINGVLVDK